MMKKIAEEQKRCGRDPSSDDQRGEGRKETYR
jgi:hypothetical protein